MSTPASNHVNSLFLYPLQPEVKPTQSATVLTPERKPNPSQAVVKPTTLPASGVRNTSPSWRILNFQDALTGSAQKPPWIINDLLSADSATLVSAQPHAMKSLSWLHACVEAVATKKVWGHFASEVKSSLFIETEDPEWLVESRIRGIAKGLGLNATDPIPGFHYACPGPFPLVETEKYLGELIAKYNPTFAVISTLQNILAGRDMNKQDQMAPVMAAVIRLSRLCPTVLVTHSPWDKKQKRATGSVTQTANFLTTMHYEKTVNAKTGETTAHVMVDSKAGALETDFHIKLTTAGDERDPGSVRTIIYGGKGWPKGNGKAAVLAAIKDNPDADPKEIADRAGVGLRYVQKIMKDVG
jgi:hypothetical protein